MTAVLDLSPDTTHPVVVGVERIHELLDAMGSDVGLAAGDYARAVGECERAISRLEAVKLRLVAGADAAGVASLSGMTGTAAWVAKHTRIAGSVAAGQVALATALEELPATETALTAGVVSAEHAAVIAAATQKLPAGLDVAQREAVEARLVDQARVLNPVELRKKARRVLEVVASRAEADHHQDRLLRDEEAAARAKTRLTLHDNHDGTVTGHFTVPALAGSILRKVIDQIASPRRAHLGALDAQAGPRPGMRGDWGRRHGEALVELLEHLPTDGLHGRVAATVVVTIDRDQLLADLGAVRLDTGVEISAGEARRLACSAAILPAVLDGASYVLDLGRKRRDFNEPQRIAGAIRHTSCAALGCDRPYAWCEQHHRKLWSLGGNTDLKDAIPLCGFHHQRIHDPAYHHHESATGDITFTKRA